MSRNDSSWKEDNVVTQASRSVEKLRDAVSQAMSHPTEQMIEQAENRLDHMEQAVREAGRVLGGNGVERAEALLEEEKGRLASIDEADGR